MAVALAAAGLSFGAALVHGSVIVEHFREYWLFGLFFAIVTPLQLGWAEAVRRSPGDRRLLAVGAAGNLAVVGVWAASRLVGLPFGPEAFEPEGIGFKDVLATLDELGLAALALVLLARDGADPLPSWTLVVAWFGVAVSLLVALTGVGH